MFREFADFEDATLVEYCPIGLVCLRQSTKEAREVVPKSYHSHSCDL